VSEVKVDHAEVIKDALEMTRRTFRSVVPETHAILECFEMAYEERLVLAIERTEAARAQCLGEDWEVKEVTRSHPAHPNLSIKPRGPGKLYPDTIIIVGGFRVTMSGVLASVKVETI